VEKLNVNQYLYHGIQPWDCFFNCRKPKESVEILEKILNTGYLAPRKLLKKTLTEEEYKLLHTTRGMNWNKDDYVSIVSTLHPEIKGLHSVLEDYDSLSEDATGFAYNFYVKQFPSIVLDAHLLQELKVNEEGNRFIGEIQIEGTIPSDYFVALTLPKIPKMNLFFQYIDSLDGRITKTQCQQWNDEEIEDLFQLTAEEFVCKYYKHVIMLEEVLRKANSNLKVYCADTGILVPSSTEQIKETEKMKKKFR